jgi:hypothetical protein
LYLLLPGVSNSDELLAEDAWLPMVVFGSFGCGLVISRVLYWWVYLPIGGVPRRSIRWQTERDPQRWMEEH